MSDFHEKAAATAKRLAASSSATNHNNLTTPEERISQSLAQDRPTIDDAVKSYLSLISARALAQSVLDDQQQQQQKCSMSSANALACCRALLKAMNQYTFAVEKHDSMEKSVVAQLWNGLVASKQKPSKYLGRRALTHAYHDLDMNFPANVEEEQTRLFQQEFGTLLQYDSMSSSESDNDGALLWAKDGGASELAKRRQRRAQRASSQETTPTIEEIDETETPTE